MAKLFCLTKKYGTKPLIVSQIVYLLRKLLFGFAVFLIENQPMKRFQFSPMTLFSESRFHIVCLNKTISEF